MRLLSVAGLTGLVVLVLGLGIGGLGVWLLFLEGSGYYIVARIALGVVGVMIIPWQVLGAWLYTT